MEFSRRDVEDLKYAKLLLENPSMAAKIVAVLGKPIEKGLKALPAGWNTVVQESTKKALWKGLIFAVKTMKNNPGKLSSDWLHKTLAGTSGGIGGAAGLLGLSIELPVSTVIMLRSIADVARSEGENVYDIGAKLACLEVLALGGKSKKDDTTETGYYFLRSILAREVSAAATYITERGSVNRAAPALIRLIETIAARFGIVVSEKAMVMAVPAVGAATSAAINVIFTDHFQDMARGHFIVRRLERTHGPDAVRKKYEEL